MDKHSRREMMKEHWRVTWPAIVIAFIIVGLAIANMVYVLTSDQPSEKFDNSNLVTGIMTGVVFIILGFNFRYYKDHYHNMAVKYEQPEFGKQTKYGIWFIISGIILIALWIVPRVLFPQ